MQPTSTMLRFAQALAFAALAFPAAADAAPAAEPAPDEGSAWLAARWAGTDLAALAAAARQWRGEKGSWPATCDEAATAYLQPPPRLDPWGSPYRCLERDGRFVILTPGPDGRDGTSDDVELDAESGAAIAGTPAAGTPAAMAPAAPAAAAPVELASPEAEATALTLRRIAEGLEAFRRKEGHYPVTEKIEHLERWLVAEHLAPAAWTTQDGWGRPLRYRTTDVGSSYTLSSAGADGRWEALPAEASADAGADLAMADGKLVRAPAGLQPAESQPAPANETAASKQPGPPKDPLGLTQHRVIELARLASRAAAGSRFAESDDAERLAREAGSPALATDGWGRPIHYLSADAGRRSAVVSAGPDGRMARDMEAYARGAAPAGDDVVALDGKLGSPAVTEPTADPPPTPSPTP